MIGTSISKAKALLAKGGLVAIPTETVYGLAGNALDRQAVLAIFKIKQRPFFDPLIVHTDTLAKVATLVEDWPTPARLLAKAFWPGPLTLLLKKQPCLPPIVTSGLSTVGIRVPQHPLTLALLQKLDFPLAAPSANPFGYISPTTAQHVADQLGGQIPYILDGGPCCVGIESTIIGFKGDEPMVYRLGGITLEAIQKVIGPVAYRPNPSHASHPRQAPGTLTSHYAPRTPLQVGDIPTLLQGHARDKVGVLAFDRLVKKVPLQQQVVLTAQGDLSQAACHLFAGLRYLDNLGLDIILASYLPDQGLGKAMNDRLRRASQRR